MPGEDSTADRQTHNESSYVSTLPGGQRLWDFCLVSTHLLINQPKYTSSHNAYWQWKCFWKSNHIEMRIMYLVSLLLKTLQWLRSWWMLVSSHMGSAHGYHLLSCSPLLSQLPSPAQPHALHSELFMLPRTCLALSSFKAFCFHGKPSAYRTFIHSFAGQPLIQEGSLLPLAWILSRLSDTSAVWLIALSVPVHRLAVSSTLAGQSLSFQPKAHCLASNSCSRNDCWIRKFSLKRARSMLLWVPSYLCSGTGFCVAVSPLFMLWCVDKPYQSKFWRKAQVPWINWFLLTAQNPYQPAPLTINQPCISTAPV